MMGDLRKLVPWLGGLLTLALLGTMGVLPNCGIARPAPPFEAEVIAGEGIGDRIVLEQMRGQIVILDFWASWCPPCRRSIPILNRIQERFGDDVLLVGVNVEGLRPEQVQRHHGLFGAEFPSVQDTRGDIQRSYAVTNLPTLVIIDGEGQIRHSETGVPDEQDLSETIDELLARNSGTP